MYTAASVYGATTQVPQHVGGPLQHAAADDMGTGWASLVNPHNPLVWFGAVLAITMGAVGVAGSARIGKGTVAAQLGKV